MVATGSTAPQPAAGALASRFRWLLRATTALGLLACCAPFYVSHVPPMTDVSQHVLVGRILAAFHDPTLAFSRYFTVHWTVAPGSVFYLLMAGLQKLVGPFRDAKVYLTAWVGATWLSVWFLARARGQSEPELAALVALPLAFCWYVWMGFLPFLATLPLFAVAVGIWCGPWRPWIKVASLWILLPVLFGFHVVGAAAAAAAVGVMAIGQLIFERRGFRPLGLAAVAVLPVPLIVGAYLLGKNAPSAHLSRSGWLSSAIDVLKYTCATLDDGAALVMGAWVTSLVGCAVALGRELREARSPILAACSLAALAVAMPADLGALWPAGPRLFPFALILLIVSIPWARIPWTHLTTVCLMLLFALSALTARRVAALDAGMRDFLDGAESVRPGSRVLPVLADPHAGSRWVQPFWSLASAYTVERGGANPYVFAAPYVKTGASPLSYRDPAALTFAFLYEPGRPAEDYRGVSASYDYVLLFGESPAIAKVLSSEMGQAYARGRVTLFARRDWLPQGAAPETSR